MRIAVCGGPYANPFALRAMIDDARVRACERIVCLGDLGGFGADCDAIWPLLLEHEVECVAGNYDVAIGRGDPDCGCGYADERDNHYAQLIYDYTREHTSPGFAAWMRELPSERRETIGGVDLHMVHGSPLAVNDFLWESLDDDELRWRSGVSGSDVLLCTHTGIPWQRRVDGALLVNVGTVGRPANDGRRETWYAVLDLEQGRARSELVTVAYDWRAQAASMRDAGLPEPFVERSRRVGGPPASRSYRRASARAAGSTSTGRRSPGCRAHPPTASAGPIRPRRRRTPARSSSCSAPPGSPPRLWIYTNFHCNLACEYCVVASSPRARRRRLAPSASARLSRRPWARDSESCT